MSSSDVPKLTPTPVEIQPHPSRRSPEDLAHQRRDLVRALGQSMLENSRLRKELYTDSLTGIANRKAFDDSFTRLVETAHTSGEPLALLIADVDGLKRTNTKLGHPGGDNLLRTVGRSFTSVAREEDLVGRYGGDEFYAILPGFLPMEGQTEDELFTDVTGRYQGAFDSGIAGLNLAEGIDAGVSFGIAILQSDETAADFLARTDSLCDANKKARYAELQSQGIVHEDSRMVPPSSGM